MNVVKRWTTSIASSFDWVISQVENHEALITSALREMQSYGSKARVQLDRVKRDGDRMSQRIVELQELEGVWAERALRIEPTDRERAYECLRRRHAATREREHLHNQVREHARMQRQLEDDLKLIDERIAELKRKKNSLSARQYRAEALKAGQWGELGIIGEIDDIFDRWEMKLGQYESTVGQHDDFEDEFRREEDRVSLEQELEQLKQSAK